MARKVDQKKMAKAGVEKNLLHWALGYGDLANFGFPPQREYSLSFSLGALDEKRGILCYGFLKGNAISHPATSHYLIFVLMTRFPHSTVLEP